MTKRPVLWVILALMVLSVTGCRGMDPFFARPTLSYEKMTVQDVSLFDAALLFSFTVNNPNPVGIAVQRGTYNFEIENASVAKGTFDDHVRVQAGGSGTINLPVHVDFMDFFNSVAALAGRDEVAYRLSGSFDVMGFTIPYKTEGRLALPEFPEITVERLNISELGFSKAKLNVILAVTNPNSFAIGLDQLEYSLDVGGLKFLKGMTESMRGIDKNSRVEITVPVEVDFISMGRSAMRLLGEDAAPYTLSGGMRFNVPGAGTRALPFSRSGEVPLRR
jgi:LEA14-like dessication related protein